MADFVAVLKKTIDGLDEANANVRRHVYDKARITIAAKLGQMNPPPPPTVAGRQKKALEEAIEKVEAGYVAAEAGKVETADELEAIFASLSDLRTPAPLPVESEIQEALTPTRKRRDPPPEPKIQSGPHFGLRGTKLTGIPTFPRDGEAGRQIELYKQIKRISGDLAANIERSANQYPELANAVRQYDALAAANIEALDITSLWAVGGSLVGFANSYREQNQATTLANPLEPDTAGLLLSLSRSHGAFMMGFEESRQLIEKADVFALRTGLIEEVSGPGSRLLSIFTDKADLVEEATRRANQPVAGYVNEFGWQSARVGYSAYLIVRNGTHSLIKFSVGSDPSVAAILGLTTGASVLLGDNNAEFIRLAVPVLHHHAQDLMVFFGHSPEFRAYLEWALDLIGADASEKLVE